MSVATWSLRERPVWSLPPTGPTISVSRRSIAMWMSSSESSKEKVPASISAATESRPWSSVRSSSSVDDLELSQHAQMRLRARDVLPSTGADRSRATNSAAERRDLAGRAASGMRRQDKVTCR